MIMAMIVSVISMTAVPQGWAQSNSPSSRDEAVGTPSGAGLQAASWLLTIPYGAVKVAFAIAGGVVGGLTYGLSGGNMNAAKSVWETTMYGTYIITPEHLKGEKPVRFLGVPSSRPAPKERPTVMEPSEPTAPATP
jgi:hypothetical protein